LAKACVWTQALQPAPGMSDAADAAVRGCLCWPSRLSGGKAVAALSAASVVLATVAYVVVRPVPCADVSACTLDVQKEPSSFHTYAVSALLPLVVYKVLAATIEYRTSKPVLHLVPDVRSYLLPGWLLSIIFLVLLLQNVTLLCTWGSGGVLDFVHMVDASTAGLRGPRPVLTVIYMESLITVPMLIVLVGKCSLGRSLDQVAGAIIWTNTYIVLAWCAYFITDPLIRWVTVMASLGLYIWVSYAMVQWVLEFVRTHSEFESDFLLKPCIAIGLILAFAVYGIIYLASMTESITSVQERILYSCMNLGVNLVVSLVFMQITTGSYHDLLIITFLSRDFGFSRQVAEAAGGTPFHSDLEAAAWGRRRS